MAKKRLNAADAAAEQFITGGWAKHPLVVTEPHPPIQMRRDYRVRIKHRPPRRIVNRPIH